PVLERDILELLRLRDPLVVPNDSEDPKVKLARRSHPRLDPSVAIPAWISLPRGASATPRPWPHAVSATAWRFVSSQYTYEQHRMLGRRAWVRRPQFFGPFFSSFSSFFSRFSSCFSAFLSSLRS